MNDDGMPPPSQYTFEELGDGLVVGRARPDGVALSNAGIVDLGTTTLIFDTSLTLRSARELRTTALARTGRTPSLVANSHWHLDHILGNQLFSEGPIYATRRTIEILVEKRAELAAELGREKLGLELAEFEARVRDATSDAGRAEYARVVRLDRALFEEADELRVTMPTEGFDRELRLPGDRRARLVSFGAGHTESDALLFLEGDRILFAGDLVVIGHHPNLVSGDPEHWIEVLDELARLGPERIVPGHGPVGTSAALGAIRDYLATLLELARDEERPEIPARFRDWEGPEQFRQNIEFLRARPPIH
jgi:cyclase